MNITRIINLFKAYFIEYKKKLLILSIIIFAVAMLESIDGLLEFAVALHFGILIAIAGMFFQPSLKRNNSTHFFNLPVTAGEKLAHVTVVLVTLSIVFHIITVVGTYAGYYLIRPIFNTGVNRFVVNGMSILESSIWYLEGYFLFAAAVSTFLFGSIYFKKMALFKTMAVGAGILLILLPLYNLLLLLIAFGSSAPFTGGEYSFEITSSVNMLHTSFYEGYKYIILSVITLFFLSLTYLRLKETEV